VVLAIMFYLRHVRPPGDDDDDDDELIEFVTGSVLSYVLESL